MTLSFEQPWWLLAALLAAPLAWVGLRWFHTMNRPRRWVTVALRAVLIALMAGMLAGAAGVRKTDRMAVVALVDVSPSVRNFVDFGADAQGRRIGAPEALRAWLARAAGRRGPDDLLAVVAFDGAPLAVQAPRAGGAPDTRQDLADLPLDIRTSEGTNIAEAIRLGKALAPPDASLRLLLLSDGNQTAGDALGAARESFAGPGAPPDAATPISVVPLAYGARAETMVEFVDAPPQARSESTITVRIGLRATEPTTGTLRLLQEGEPVDLNGAAPGDGRRVTLAPGGHVELVEVKLDKRTIHRFKAFFEPDPGPDGERRDTLVSNNRGEAFTVTPGKGPILVVDGVSDGDPRGAGATLSNALAESGLDVETIAPASLPNDLLALHGYDLIILENVPADAVPRSTQALLVDYVSQLGGGLLMVGGPDAFGAGGWKGSPIEPILPVKLDLPEQLVRPKAAIVLVLDNSGSMGRRVLGGSRTQQDIANEAAALAIETLDKQDLVGVITFNNDYDVLAPLAADTDPNAVADRVRSIAPGGGTNMYPAMAQAAQMLRAVDAQVKHVVVLTDGRSMGLPGEGVDIAASMRASGITCSTIAVGDEADTDTLAAIAGRGGGTYHRVIDPYSLPRIFFKEIRVVRKPMIRESPFAPVVLPTGSPLIAGAPAPWPTLGGLVLTQPRNDPAITLAARTPTGEPLLAHWNVGLGRVAAFTSDAHNWASQWLDWPGYRRLWTQVARTIARPPSARNNELTTEIVGDQLRIRLLATDDEGKPLDLLSVPGSLYAPGSSRPREVRLAQTGPGLYETAAPASESGTYVVVLTPRMGDTALPPVIGGAARSGGAEFRRLRSDVALLRDIADATGGRILDLARPDAADLFDRAGIAPSRAATPIWRLLMVWCLLVLLLDVASRRLAWDRLFSRQLAAELRAGAEHAVRERADRAAATVSRLRVAAERLAPSRDEPGRDAESASPSPRRARAPSPSAPPAPPPGQPQSLADRQEAIRRALRATQGRPDRRDGPAPTPPKPATTPAVDAAGPGGLLAAKRRAQGRFGNEEAADDEPQHPQETPKAP